MSDSVEVVFSQRDLNVFRVNQRVKWFNPENLAWAEEFRGRIIYLDDSFVHVIQDGKTFAQWLRRTEVKPER